MRIKIKVTTAHKFNFDIMNNEEVKAVRTLYNKKTMFHLVSGTVSAILTIICLILFNVIENVLVPGILFFVFLVPSIIFFWRGNIFYNGRKDCDDELERRTSSLSSETQKNISELYR